MNKILHFCSLFVFFVMLSACHNYYYPKRYYYTIMLYPEIVACEGWMGYMEKCMQIKVLSSTNPRMAQEGKWDFLYNSIEGFKPEKGYIYQLYVKDTDLSKYPVVTDRFGQYWTLVKMIHKEKINQN